MLGVLGVVATTTWSVGQNPRLDPDDYRYLHGIRALDENFWGGLRETSIVENRWDHLWWMDAGPKVRFFRPTIALSYWIDSKLHGDDVITGLLMTNVLLHLACSLLVCVVLLHWVGPGLPGFLGSLLFAALFCHGEVLWYVAGRTDTLAALGFLGGLVLHQEGQSRPRLRWLALPCYAFAFVSKELTVVLPLVCFLNDRAWGRPEEGSVACLRRDWKLYTGYVAVALLVQTVRGFAVSSQDTGWVYPYFVAPWRADFPAHLWVQVRTYGENLLLARTTKPFMTLRDLPVFNSTFGLVVTLGALWTAVWTLRRDRLLAVLLTLGIGTWLPTSVVYVSERYLYLPSVAVVGACALVLQRLRVYRKLWILGVGMTLVWGGHQGLRLAHKNQFFMVQAPRAPEYMEEQLRPLASRISSERTLLILNLPGAWLHAQFTEDQLRVQLADPKLRVRVLTIMPPALGMGAGMEVERTGERDFVVRGAPVPGPNERSTLLEKDDYGFPWVDLRPGTRIERPGLGFTVEVVRGTGDRCSELRFFLPEPLEHYTLLRWEPSRARHLSGPERRRRGRVEIVSLAP